MRKIAVVMVSILIITLAAGCSSKSIDYQKESETMRIDVEKKDNTINYLKDQISKLEKENREIKEENERLSNNTNTIFGEHFVTVLKEILGEEEAIKLAQKQIKYSVNVNGIPIKNKVTSVPKGEVIVSVSEGYVHLNDQEIIIPPQFFDMGFIDYNGGKDFSEHIEVISDQQYFKSGGAGTIVWSDAYVFENAKAGSVIKVKITEQLKKRLGVDHTEFEIRITN
jgi:hypothetical protein